MLIYIDNSLDDLLMREAKLINYNPYNKAIFHISFVFSSLVQSLAPTLY